MPSPMTKTEKTKKNSVKTSTLIYSFLIIILACIAILSGIIFFFDSNNRIIQKTARFLPIPAAIIGYSDFILYGNLKDQLDSIQKFYENQNFEDIGMRVDFSTPDGKKRLKIKEKEILNKLIENKIIEGEAKKRGIKLTNAMVEQEVEREIQQFFGDKESIEENLERLYGWNIIDFEKNIVKPDLYRERLTKHLEDNDAVFLEARKKIDAAQKELTQGKDFGEVAKKYSEGESAGNKGELGWFTSDQMLAEIANVAAALDKNRASEIIKSPLGYHIIVITDKKTEEGGDSFQVKQIFVRGKSLADWLDQKEENTSIFIPLSNFTWDENSKSVEFEKAEMKNFEKRESGSLK